VKAHLRIIAPLALVGVAALVACNSSNAINSVPNCGAPSGKVVLVYPAPNSTGIPDNFPGVIFGSSSGLASSYQALLLPAGNSQFVPLESVAAAPSPLPSPYQTPSFANPVYQESASGGVTLPSGTSVQVFLNDQNSNCSPALLGAFTSQ